MKIVLINLAYELIRKYVGTGLFDRIKDLVLELMEKDLSWSEKADIVRINAWKEVPKLRQVVIDLAIGTIMAKYSVKDNLDTTPNA